ARTRGRPRHGRRAELVDRRLRAARSLVGTALLAGAELLPLAHDEFRSRRRDRGGIDGAAGRQAGAGRVRLGGREAEPPGRTGRGREPPCRGGAAALGLRARLHPADGSAAEEITGRVLTMVPLRNRRGGVTTRIAEGLTEWQWRGRVGYGWSE